ncbi:MAG: hypothetical protein GAK41_00391 [Burkholderia gladioli]|nr:MAG: hypothetical protein GAK41_00391 [Burkholderia gladioli]
MKPNTTATRRLPSRLKRTRPARHRERALALLAACGGRFTTSPGEVWTQKVAEFYGDTLKPAYEGGFGVPLQATGGLGYAQGGSRVTLQPGLGHADASVANADYAQATTTPIATQLQQYLQAHGSFNANQLVLIKGGANDILYQAQVAQAAGNTQAAQLAAAQAVGLAAQQLGAVIAQIPDNGATHVFVSNMPDIGATPLALAGGVATQAALTQLSALQVDTTKVKVMDAFTYSRTASARTSRPAASRSATPARPAT